MDDFDPADVPTKELIIRLKNLLSERELIGLDIDDVRTQLAGLHSELSVTQCNAVARFMLEELHAAFSAEAPLSALLMNILELVDPYLLKSDLVTEARLIIGAEFRRSDWNKENFDRFAAIAMALINLEFVDVSSKLIWNEFYDRFKSDDDLSLEAAEISLAGLSNVSVESFGSLLKSMTVSETVMDLLELYVPSLIRLGGRAAVEALLSEFISDIPPSQTKSLRSIAEYNGIKLKGPALKLVAPDHAVPTELIRAWERLLDDRQENPKGRLSRAAQSAQKANAKIIYSDYIDSDIAERYQDELIELVKKLDPDIHTQRTRNFAELSAENFYPVEFVYAFPTYLTINKERNGYSVFPIGLHRRLGIVLARNNVLSTAAKPIKTLNGLLDAMRPNVGGKIYCLKNWAIEEIIQETIYNRPALSENIALMDIITTLQPISGGAGYIPEISGMDGKNINIRASAFVFDLGSLSKVQKQISQSKKSKIKSKEWLSNAIVLEIGHDLDIPVGIGFNLYGADWAMADNRWAEIRKFSRIWASKKEFVDAMKRVGVEVIAPQTDFEASSKSHGLKLI